MPVRKILLLLLATIIGHGLLFHRSNAADIAPRDSFVRVRMNADFHPELEFRIAEALRRPPLDWSVARDHTFAEMAQPVENEAIADEIVARWETLFANNPTHVKEKAVTLASQWKALEEASQQFQAVSGDFIAAWINQATHFTAKGHPADQISLADLPTIHTGEEIATELQAEFAQFPLDPYGYEEYNCYFEPEIYDWFVFVTDDLTVVYVHENSDVMPLAADSEMLAAQMDEPAVPESVKVLIRESVRAVFSGEIQPMDVVSQAKETWQATSTPIWNRYVKENQLLKIERVAQLREIFRF